MKNKKVLILGGTGALGKSLIKRYYDNNDIIVFSRDEHKHVDLLKKYDKLESYLGDIRDKSSVENALVRYKPDVVINTAALKHVPICENNPIESVKTNIIGHQNVIECVGSHNVETLIFVSTDKACKPINVYGMCKAISEQLYISFAKQQQVTKVVMVRYGNVLESTGSVIPVFSAHKSYQLSCIILTASLPPIKPLRFCVLFFIVFSIFCSPFNIIFKFLIFVNGFQTIHYIYKYSFS